MRMDSPRAGSIAPVISAKKAPALTAWPGKSCQADLRPSGCGRAGDVVSSLGNGYHNRAGVIRAWPDLSKPVKPG